MGVTCMFRKSRNVLAACALLLAAAPLAAQDAEDERVRAQREAFNHAIAVRDIAGVTAVLSEDVVLVTGTDSDLFLGRDAQVKIWADDFAVEDSALYVRTTASVSLSPTFPLALETGTWRGVSRGDPGDWANGTYTAKWRLVDGIWLLEAEIFMTTGCGGTFCP